MMSGASQVPDTPNLAMRGGRGGSSRLGRGGRGRATGLSRPVAQCDLPTSDVTVKCSDKGEDSTSHELSALKLAMEEIRTIIISMQQEKSGGAADLPMKSPTATNRSRQGRPKKFNFQPWPEINQDIGQLGRFPDDERPTHYFDKYFMMKIEGDKRKMNPFDIEKEYPQN